VTPTDPVSGPSRTSPDQPLSERLVAVAEALFATRVSPVAAAALVADFARHPGPKHGLVVGAGPASAVLTAAIDALAPDDSLTVVAGAATEDVRSRIRLAGTWVEQRVTVVESLADAPASVDAIIVAEPLVGSADETRAQLETLGKHLGPGAVLSVAVPLAPLGERLGGALSLGLARGAGEELARQATLFGVGSDVVLRSRPPLRVHRLRYTPADPALAERLAPLARTSSVRLTPRLNIDSSGVAAAAMCLGTAAALRRLRPGGKLWWLPALAAVPVAAFFRDPQRDVPTDPATIVAASDGKVLSVKTVRDERLGSDEFLRIAVFLSVLDVHINRSPVAGRVVDHFVVDGGYAAAMHPEAEHNVSAYTVLETTRGTVAVVQRTGLVARRIVQRAPVGALLAKGERFGLIRFGSRTDVYLPADRVEPLVHVGDRVVGGETVIARWTV
jgi:phosphatidylserine decarboxylase